MILLEPHVWEKSGSRVKYKWAWVNAKMLSANQIGGFSSFNISKTIGVIKLIFTCRYIPVKATN